MNKFNVNLLSSSDFERRIDFERMSKERLEKTWSAMKKHDVDALVLFRSENVRYVSASRHLHMLAQLSIRFPEMCVVKRGDSPYVFTTEPEGVPSWIPDDHVKLPIFGYVDADIDRLGKFLKENLPPSSKIGVDIWPSTAYRLLPKTLSGHAFADGEQVVMDALMYKTKDEIECLKAAQYISAQGIISAYELIMTNDIVRESDLKWKFAQTVVQLGAEYPGFEGVFCVTNEEPVSWPSETPGGEPVPIYRKIPGDRVIRDGDLVHMDCGAFWNGYSGDFTRTWYVGKHSKPSEAQKKLARRALDIYEKSSSAFKKGNTLADVHEDVGEFPTYYGHSLGVSTTESPVVGGPYTRLDDEKDVEIKPGLCITMEPYVYEKGVGGFRFENIFIMTESGAEEYKIIPNVQDVLL